MSSIKLDVREVYLELRVIKDYIERFEAGLEATNRTLPEYLADRYEMLNFHYQVSQEIISDLQRLLMVIKELDTTSDEIKKEIDNTVVGMF